MSITLTFPFTTPSNYTYDSDKIEIAGGIAKLKLSDNVGQTFNEDFADDTDFIYDADKAEFVGGQVRQKSQRPAGMTFGAKYTTDIDGTIGDGDLTGTGVGGAGVSGGELDLAHGDIRYVDYDADLNADSQQVGCIRFLLAPNYSGSPTIPKTFFTICKEAAGFINGIFLSHLTNGTLLGYFYDSSGALIGTENFGAWSPTASTEYEFELNWDFTTGATRLFIDGIQKGSTETSTGTRDANIGLLRIGSDYAASNPSDFAIDDLIVFSTVQHTSNYTPGYTVPDIDYVGSKVECPQFSYSGIGVIQVFTNFVTTEGGTPRYVVNDLYWTGAVWGASDGSYAQANIKADILINIATLPASDTVDIDIVFDSDSTQGSVADLTVTYTGQIYSTTNPQIVCNATFRHEGIDGFTETKSASGSDEVKYILKKGTVKYYWTGSAWAVSDGTYAQANTAAEIETNKATFTDIGVITEVTVLFHSEDGSATPELDALQVDYDFSGSNPDSIETCIVWGYQVQTDTEADPEDITVYLVNDAVQYKTNITIRREVYTVTPDVNGYWEVELVESENMDGTQNYAFEIGGERFEREVPNEISANFYELT